MRKQLSRALAAIDARVVKPIARAAEKRRAGMDENAEDPRRIIRQGVLVVGILFGALGLWSVLGHISGAVVAPGRIKIETERKTVQHLEGGIVDAILVREGEEVRAGQPLIILESVQIDANASMLQKQLVAQSAARIRLAAEKDLKDALRWPGDLRQLAEDSHSADVLENEERIFTARRDALNAQVSLLNAQLAQLEAQAAGFDDQMKAEQAIIGTLDEELRAKRQLYRERYLEKSQILELERTLAGHQGNRGRLKQSIAEARQKAAELNLRIEEVKVRFVEEAASGLGKLENDIVQTRERIRPLKDARKRLRIAAPVGGRVEDLKVHSRGGVVRPGEPLMDIVPHDNPLIVESHVPVHRITDGYVGQDALVQLDAFDTRIIPHMPGKITYISADRLEERTSAGAMPYYLCYVEIDPKALTDARLYLSPGMPATVFITTRQSTVLYYMMEPLIKNWDRALRE